MTEKNKKGRKISDRSSGLDETTLNHDFFSIADWQRLKRNVENTLLCEAFQLHQIKINVLMHEIL